ncbi:MAG: arylesterase [Pseudomonadota bacterium]
MRNRAWSKIVAPLAMLALVACGGETVPEAADTIENTGEEATVPVMGPEVDILAFGDSLFAGYGVGLENSYPAKLEAALRAQGINAQIANAGVSGDTSAAGAQRLAFTLDSQEEKPDLFILELGGNDMLRQITPEQTRANFTAMLEELKAREIPVLIMGMRAPPNLGPEYQAEFDGLYGELALEYGATLIPFWLESIYQEPELFQRDRIHPTVEGLEQLVEATVDQVRAALPEDE